MSCRHFSWKVLRAPRVIAAKKRWGNSKVIDIGIGIGIDLFRFSIPISIAIATSSLGRDSARPSRAPRSGEGRPPWRPRTLGRDSARPSRASRSGEGRPPWRPRTLEGPNPLLPRSARDCHPPKHDATHGHPVRHRRRARDILAPLRNWDTGMLE